MGWRKEWGDCTLETWAGHLSCQCYTGFQLGVNRSVSCIPKSRTSIITDSFHLDAALPCVCVGAEEQCVYHLHDKYVFAGQMDGPDIPSRFGGSSEVKGQFDITHTRSITVLGCQWGSFLKVKEN